MNLRFLAQAGLLAAVAAVRSFAASANEEEESNLNLTLPTDEWYVPKSKISFGFRFLTKGANVKFGNLGGISTARTLGPDGSGNRVYDTGFVNKDALRDSFETLSAPDNDTKVGIPTYYGQPLGNGRYLAHRVTRATEGGPLTDTVVGEGLGYNAAYSRTWSTNSANFVNGTLLRMSNYGTASEGATAEGQGTRNGGVEISLARDIGKLGKRVDWSIAAGVALTPLNTKAGGHVRSTLTVYSDYYRLAALLPAGTLNGPTFGDFDPATDGNDGSLETTVAVSATPDTTVPGNGQTQSLAGAADVLGNWQVKGAYFMLRVGPQFRTQITDRFGLSAGLGLAGAFTGTRYSVVESITVPDIAEPITEEVADTHSAFLGGFYADMNVEWVATERTGLYAGVNMQHFGGYDQTVAGRTAKIDLGSAVGIRGGINYRF